MINNNIAYDAITAQVRTIKTKVEVFNASTLLYTFTADDKLSSFTIERGSELGLFFGFGICQHIKININDTNRDVEVKAKYKIRVSYLVNDTWVYPHPTFFVTQSRRDENTNELSIYGYDCLYNANKLTVDEVGVILPYTVREFAAAAAAAIGADGISIERLVDENSFNISYELGANFTGTEKLRDAINDLAEATQTIYYINADNKLVFKRLNQTDAADLTIRKADYFTLINSDNRRLAAICSATELGDNYTAALDGVSGTTQYLRDNAFITNRDDVAILVDNALAAVGGLTINQFECEWRGNYLLELGDKIALAAKDDTVVYSFLLDDVIEYDGSYIQKSKWLYDDEDTADESNSTSLGEVLKQTYAKVDKVNKTVEIVAGDVSQYNERISTVEEKTEEAVNSVSQYDERIAAAEETANSAKETADGAGELINSALEDSDNNAAEIVGIKTELAQLKLDTSSIVGTVKEVKESTTTDINTLKTNVSIVEQKVSAMITAEDVSITVKKELTNSGVKSIETENGFTFNSDGLTIEKSNSEISTVISENGMVINKNSTPVLVANNVGVDATNLHATTYLIIGGNSRIEDYESGARTGCFWIGG